MSFLVTGSAGFIGSHTAHALLARGDPVIGIDNLNPYYDPALKEARHARLTALDGFTAERIDIADRVAVTDVFRRHRPRRVIHLAAQAGVRYSVTHPQAYADSNLLGFANILEACRDAGIEHLVYASTSSVYGANTEMPFREDHGVGHPMSLYAATKRANEVMAHAYAHLFGLPCTGLRFFTVYGPWGRPDMALFKFTRAILNDQAIDIYNHGDMQRDFTYIDDIVEGVVRVADRPPTAAAGWQAGGDHPDPGVSGVAPWRIYNIGRGAPVSLMAFVRLLEDALGRRATTNMMPMQPGDVAATYADTSALAAAVGYAPTTPIEVGIARFVAWYRNYHHV